MSEILPPRDDADLALKQSPDGRSYNIVKRYPKKVRLRRAWGCPAPRPKVLGRLGQGGDAARIDIAIDTRVQTILSRRLPPRQRAMVDGMERPRTRARTEAETVHPLSDDAYIPFFKFFINDRLRNAVGLPKVRVAL